MTWIVLSSVAIVGYFVGQYFTDTLQNLAKDSVGLSVKYSSHGPVYEVAFYCHVIFAGITLFLGPFQFIAWIRNHHRNIHRTIGKIYIGSVFIGGTAALIMSTINTAGISGFFGFGSLALMWIFVTFKGYRAIRTGDVASHQAWMMRSFALTYAGVTLRLWLGILIGIQIPFTPQPFDFNTVFGNAYAPVPYLSWIPNIVIAEFLIRSKGLPSLHLTAAK